MNPIFETAEPLRVLVVVAHPDDAEYAVAGTVAAWTRAGTSVAYCLLTRGESGGFEVDPDIAARREAEQRAAAAVVGVDDVVFLDETDGAVQVSQPLRLALTQQIRRVRPHIVVGHCPQRDWDRIVVSHPDHLAAGDATLTAVYPDSRNRFAHPGLTESPWTVPRVWLTGAPTSAVNHVSDITETFDQKVEALRAHVSQTGHELDLAGRLRSRALLVARRGGLADGRLGEAFQVVDTT